MKSIKESWPWGNALCVFRTKKRKFILGYLYGDYVRIYDDKNSTNMGIDQFEYYQYVLDDKGEMIYIKPLR